jgi:PIN domain nuclease of toxin-antitoxin system
VKLLPDTHAALWLLSDDPQLSARAAELLTDRRNEVMLSAAVVWEVAIKRSLGKLKAPDGFADLLIDSGAQPLSVTVAHAEAAGALDWHRRDPFDRMLAAQATIEGATVVSADSAFGAYDVSVAW